MYKIELKKSVKKDLKQIEKSRISYILGEVEKLSYGIENNEQIIKLKGNNPYYRLKLDYGYRVIFEKKDDILIIIIVRVGHRKDIYKNI